MKKLLIALTFALVMAGCSKPTETPNNDVAKDVNYKAGSASVTTITAGVSRGKNQASFETTYAGVVLDENNTIVYVSFDTVTNSAAMAEDGTFGETQPGTTKKELGTNYGMSKVSSIGKDWHEQIAAFEASITGKKIDDVLKMELDNGKSTDADVLSGCTIAVSPYLTVLEKAYANVKDTKNVANFALGSLSTVTAKDVQDDKGSVSAETNVVFYALDKDGKVVYMDIDTVTNSASVNGAGEWTTPETATTKKELGSNYGMGKISSIGKDWHEQIAAFEEYTLGKTIAEVTGMTTESGKATDADLLAGCTIGITGYLEAVAHASTMQTSK